MVTFSDTFPFLSTNRISAMTGPSSAVARVTQLCDRIRGDYAAAAQRRVLAEIPLRLRVDAGLGPDFQ